MDVPKIMDVSSNKIMDGSKIDILSEDDIVI